MLEEVYNFGLYLINDLLHKAGHSLQDFPLMPLPQHDWNAQIGNSLIAKHLAYDQDEQQVLAEQHIAMLNEEQWDVYNVIIQSVLK